jgi:hypothetical protein
MLTTFTGTVGGQLRQILLYLKDKDYPITGRQEPRGGSRGIALLILDLGARMGWVVSTTPQRLYPPGKTRYPL